MGNVDQNTAIDVSPARAGVEFRYEVGLHVLAVTNDKPADLRLMLFYSDIGLCGETFIEELFFGVFPFRFVSLVRLMS